LTPKLGEIGNWGLNIEKNAIVVNNALIIKPISMEFTLSVISIPILEN
jgi:hypothetical protein